MSISCSVDILIKEFSKSILDKRASIFIGSGLSRPAGFAGWKDVLRECAEEIGLDVEKEERNLITLAEYYAIGKQRTKINTTIKEFFADNKGEPTINHSLISTLPISSIWTTNYDRLIERTYEKANIHYSVLTDDSSYKELDNSSKIIIHKIHGDVNTSDKCVITRKDYEEFIETHDIVLSELKGEMCSNSFLFLGYSFSDTDIQHILSKIRLIYKHSHPRRHYCIIEKVNSTKCKDNIEYQYECKKQEHHIADMQSYGLNVVLVDSYDDITNVLGKIRQRVLLKNILISGAYDLNYAYASRCSKFAEKISTELIKNSCKIFTGYGENLGSDIVAGAFDGCRQVKKEVKDFNENVFLFPFPYKKKKTPERDELYQRLRINMISHTQIMIIIGGSKIEKGQRSNADGIEKEVEIANTQGVFVIPIASTGGSALQIWDEINKSGSVYAKSDEFQELSKVVSPDEAWNVVNTIIAKYIKLVIESSLESAHSLKKI